MFNWFTGLWGHIKNKIIPEQVIERTFQAVPDMSQIMLSNINLWYALFTNHPPWENQNVRPLGLPAAVVRELARPVLAESVIKISGSARANYLSEQFDLFESHLKIGLELGLALGGVAFKPYVSHGRILVDTTYATNFIPIKFDGTGTVIAGVFKETAKVGKSWYARLEYHSLEVGENTYYTVENRAFKSDQGGTVGAPAKLTDVPAWAEVPERTRISNVERPLFAYFKPPKANDMETDSPIGVSVYSGSTVDLLKQADEQWEKLCWEYKSGERKIFVDGTKSDAAQAKNARLFEYGSFDSSGDFFQEFTPEFRDEPLYRGFQNILKQIEFNVGLSHGTLSDPQTVEKTATEIVSSKQRMYVTVKDIQKELESAIDGVIAAMDAYCDLFQLAPSGPYTVEYEWGDGVVQDTEAKQKELAEMRNDVAAGLLRPEIYLAKRYGVTEDDALLMMPEIEQMVQGVM